MAKFAQGKIVSILPAMTGIRSTTPIARTTARARAVSVCFSHSKETSKPDSVRRTAVARAGVK
jgi:hypothetical protein